MDSIRIHVPNELFAPAESLHFEGEVEIPVLKAGPDLYTFDGPLAWQADITNTGDAFLVAGTVEGAAKTACARCLEDVPFDIVGEIEGYFLIGGEDAEAPEDMDDDEFDVLPDNNEIDMLPLIQAAVLLELPLIPLCDDDCRGICPTCGANLNDEPCSCDKQAEDDAFADAKNPFAVLKGYDFGDAEDAEDAGAAAGDAGAAIDAADATGAADAGAPNGAGDAER